MKIVIAFLLALPSLAVAPPVRAETDIDIGGDGRTLIVGLNVGEPGHRETSTCRWRTTVVADGDETTHRMVRDGVAYRRYARICPSTTTAGGYELTYHWVPVVSQETMATQASALAVGLIPVPIVGTSPPAHRGIVKVPMWWWVSPASWRTVSVSVWLPTPAGPITVRATARPLRLLVDPADPRALGGGRRTCVGPGLAWRKSMGDDAVGPCMHTYNHAFPAARARVTIEWAVSWKSNRGGAGRLPNRRTTRTVRVKVGEIQALVSH
ncbi:MAG: hypothetical protein FJW44_01755 [Actinobacteria bacterium]|nr:hypothetical protein [Actinomycetota bacterium]